MIYFILENLELADVFLYFSVFSGLLSTVMAPFLELATSDAEPSSKIGSGSEAVSVGGSLA